LCFLDDDNTVNTDVSGVNSSILTVDNTETFTWSTVPVNPNSFHNIVSTFAGNTGKFVLYQSSNQNPASTTTSFDVTLTFATPQRGFVLEAFDFDGPTRESITNFNIQPTTLSANAQNIGGTVTSTISDQDIVLTWLFDSPVTTLTFTVERPTSTLSIGFNAGLIGACDTDGDGILNHLDLDADNDGIFDAVEAGHGFAQTNGVVDGSQGTDGIPDAVQATSGPNSGVVDYTIADSESSPDGIPDYLELDSDGDGCNDVLEAGFTDDNDDGVLGDAPVTVDINGVVNETNGGTAISNVLVNDEVNGNPATLAPANVLLTIVTPASDAGVVLNTATGAVTVAPGTPAGVYQITYQICAALATTVCDTMVMGLMT